MKPQHLIFRVVLACLGLLFLAAGCLAGGQITSTPSPTKTINRDEHMKFTVTPHERPATPDLPPTTPSSAPTATPTVRISSTATSSPTRFPATPTMTSSPSPTPLTKEEANQLVMELLQTNAGCRLPCWWGLTPGETSWETAYSFLSLFDSDIYISGSKVKFTAEVKIYDLPEDIAPAWLDASVSFENEIIQTIDVFGFDGAPIYRLSPFLQAYGQPEEVWLHTYNFPEPGLPFAIFLFYPQQGILAYYPATDQAVSADGTTIHGCILKSPFFYLWIPGMMSEIHEVGKYFRFDILTTKPLLPLKDATGMDVSTFYQTYKDPQSSPCFETPADLWPIP